MTTGKSLGVSAAEAIAGASALAKAISEAIAGRGGPGDTPSPSRDT